MGSAVFEEKLELKKLELRKQQSELLCDISDGRLLERGSDPFREGSKEAATAPLDYPEETTSGKGRKPWFIARAGPELAPAAQVLGLAVGLLGLEVHEAPNPWAEAWLTFDDATRNKLGLGSGVQIGLAQANKRKKLGEEQLEWQARVLSHLQNLVTQNTIRPTGDEAEQAALAAQLACQPFEGPGLGPDFAEHIDLAHFMLTRITAAVVNLQDPERQERPMLLREYTDEMVLQVCRDLRQWMEQLATLFSIYHVHLLDLETERRRLKKELESQQSKFNQGEEERKLAVLKFERFNEVRQEERMRARAEALLGITLAGEDAKIYSQQDVDDMMKDWEKEHVQPLMADIAELRAKRDELMAKLGKKGGKSGGPGEQMEPASQKVLIAAIKALSERTFQEEVQELLDMMAASVEEGGGNMSDVLRAITRLPTGSSGEAGGGPGGAAGGAGATSFSNMSPKAQEQMSTALATVAKEMEKLEKGLKECKGLETIAGLAGWAKETINVVMKKQSNFKGAPGWQVASLKAAFQAGGGGGGGKAGSWRPGDPANDSHPATKCLDAVISEMQKFTRGLNGVSGAEKAAGLTEWVRDTLTIFRNADDNLKWKQAPMWDLSGLGGGGGPGAVSSEDMEALWKARMEQLRRELEEKLRKALEALEAEKEKTAEALQKLADESHRADNMQGDLRKKLIDMQQIMKRSGLGKEAQAAITEAGLDEFLNCRDVFERLYRDALTRMRRLAEAQMEKLAETTEDYNRTFRGLYSPMLDEGVPQCISGTGSPSGVVIKGPTLVDRHKVVEALYDPSLGPIEAPLDSLGEDSPRSPLQVVRLGPKSKKRDQWPADGQSEAPPSQARDLVGTPPVQSQPQRLARPPQHYGSGVDTASLGPLPPLECNGRPMNAVPVDPSDGAQLAAGGALSRGSTRIRSPSDGYGHAPGVVAQPLTVSCYGGNPAAVGRSGGSLLLPPPPLVEGIRYPASPPQRAGAQGKGLKPVVTGPRNTPPQRQLIRGGGSSSMPQLGPPRLLVQSLGSC